MKKCLTGLRILSLLLLCIALGALWRLPMGRMKKEEPLPRAQRQLITVWICGEGLPVSAWVKQQATAYQKAHTGVSIWVRTAATGDMELLREDCSHAAPDVLLFMAGEKIEPAWFEELAFCKSESGQHGGRQLAAPVCMAGYALVRTAKEGATPAPTSLFGVTPVPQKTAAATPPPKEEWPQKIVTDDRFGAWLLPQMNAAGEVLPEAEAMEKFFQGKAEAALLSTVALRKLSARGKGMEVLEAAKETDLVLYGGVMREAASAAEDFLRYLCSADAQKQLSASGLISPQNETLYGAGTPILQAAEQALRQGNIANAFEWQHLSQSTFLTGQAMSAD